MRARFGPGANPVGSFLAGLCLCLLLLWARYNVFWARYTPPRVNVRWTDTTAPSTRQALEAKHRLEAPRSEGGRTWSYRLADDSVAAIRGLVADPDIEDTHNIDRQRFELTGENAPGRLEGPLWFLWAAAISVLAGGLAAWIGQDRWWRVGSLVTRSVATIPLLATRSAAAAVAPDRLRWIRTVVTRSVSTAPRTAASLLTRGVPDLRADVLGFFRFFYAAFLFIALVNGRLRLEPGRIPDDGQLGWRWVGWLASRPDLMAPLEYALLALLVLFAFGLWTRLTYGVFAAGMTLWVTVWIESQHSNAHTWLAPFVMILCLVPVPWDAGLSLDNALRRWRGRHSVAEIHGKCYGYAVWMPGLILGTVWASAAYAKLDNGGLGWMLGGAVKYHWVMDAEYAPVKWGLWIAAHHWAAVLMSFGGVFVEGVFIVSAFVKPGTWRALLTSTGFALLVGFYLFQGVLWWRWWLVYLCYAIPWTLLFDSVASPIGRWFRAGGTERAHRSAGELRPVHIVLVILVCVHAMLRLPAGFGRFESYSNTYDSTTVFDEINPLRPIERLWIGYGSASAAEVESEVVVDAILRLSQGEPLPSDRALSIRGHDQVQPLGRDSPARLTLTRQQRSFDWTNGRFNAPGHPVVIGTLDLESMTLVAEQRPPSSPATSPSR